MKMKMKINDSKMCKSPRRQELTPKNFIQMTKLSL